MSSLGALLKHPEDILPLLKLKMVIRKAERQIPQEPYHWTFCYNMLHKVARSFALTIQQLDNELRDPILIFYLVLRALDTVEDDTSIPSDVKVPILKAFYQHLYDPHWNFSCGTDDCRVLMDEFHHVRKAFLELKKSHRDVITDITRRMGAGMAKFILKEIVTVEDLNEYAHYVAGVVGLGLSKLFYASGSEDLAPESLSNSMGLLLQNANLIRDYLEDINEIPKSRMFWPRKVWSKYVDKLEDLKHEEKSVEALQCLNEMLTNALVHVENCLKYLSSLRDPAIFRFCAVPQVMAMGTLTLCYNNIQVFRTGLKLRRGLTAKLIDRTRNMSDVFVAFFEFASILKAKVEKSDPNALRTLSILEAIQKICRDSGLLNDRKFYIVRSEQGSHPAPRVVASVAVCVGFAYLSALQLNSYWEFIASWALVSSW